MNRISTLLREYRKRSGLTQKEAAIKSAIGDKTLASFEHGSRIDSMKVSHLFALLAIYSISLETFAADYLGVPRVAPVPETHATRLEKINAEIAAMGDRP